MKLSLLTAAGGFSNLAAADYCRYRIRSYTTSDCNGDTSGDAHLSSRDCFDTRSREYIWIDNLNGTDYCASGNWIREYANYFSKGSCSNNNRGQQDVSMGTCIRLQHYKNGGTFTDSIRINYQ